MRLGFGLGGAIILCNLPLHRKLAIYISCVRVGFVLGLSFLLCSLLWGDDLLILRAARGWLGPSIYFLQLTLGPRFVVVVV